MMLQDWKNPSEFAKYEKKLDIEKDGGWNILDHSFTLSKEDLKNMQVISQVDYKFILTKLNHQLFLFDQHAVDERVQLEKFQRQLFGIDGRERNILSKKVSEKWEMV